MVATNPAVPVAKSPRKDASGRVIKRRLTPEDIEAVARLLAKRLTLQEACAKLQIAYSTFTGWLARNDHDGKFSSLVTRIRAERLDAMIESIDEAATKGDERGRRDWRAAAWLASRVHVDDGRFDERKAEPEQRAAIDVAALLASAARVYAAPPNQAVVSDAPKQAALPEPSKAIDVEARPA